MKTFTATQLNKSAQEVFAAAKDEGTVLIEHDRYSGVFAIVWNPQYSEAEVLGQIKAAKNLVEIGAGRKGRCDKELLVKVRAHIVNAQLSSPSEILALIDSHISN